VTRKPERRAHFFRMLSLTRNRGTSDLNAFMERCGAFVVGSTAITLQEVTRNVFRKSTSGRRGGEKKSEFPDAISAVKPRTMGAGITRGKKVLVVSQRQGMEGVFATNPNFLSTRSIFREALALLPTPQPSSAAVSGV